MKLKPLIFFFVLIIHSIKAQYYNLPNDYFFSLFTEKKLAEINNNIHTNLKPYIPFFSKKYLYVTDSHSLYKNSALSKFIFLNHAIKIESPTEKFKLQLDPILNLEIGKDFADTLNNKLYTNTRGFIGSGQVGDKVYFESMFVENQSFFPNYINSNAKLNLVIPGQGRWKSFNGGGYDYAFSSGFVSIQASKNFNIQFGHGKHKIGAGYRSLLLSDNSFNYPYARFTQQWFKGKIQYTTIYAVLMNLVPASLIQLPNTERLFQKKAASFHYLSLNITKSINLGFFQGTIWQVGDKKNQQNLSWQYFNPIIYSNLAAYNLNHTNNVLIGSEIKIKLSNKLNTYSQIMLDDLSDTNKIGKSWGYQLGFNYFDALGINNLFFQIEYNAVMGSSYKSPTNIVSDQSFTHYNQPLAFSPGIGTELVALSDYRWKRFFLSMKYNYLIKEIDLKNKSNTTNFNAKIGYLINPSYNLSFSIGINYHSQNFYNFGVLNNQTNYVYFSFKTNLYNQYYDF